MAQETTTPGPSLGERIGQGIEGGLNIGMKLAEFSLKKKGMEHDWQQQADLAAAKAQEFKLKQDEAFLNMHKMRTEMSEKGTTMLDNLYSTGISTDNPEAFADLNKSAYAQAKQYQAADPAAQPPTEEEFQAFKVELKNQKAVFGKPQQEYNKIVGSLGNTGGLDPDKPETLTKLLQFGVEARKNLEQQGTLTKNPEIIKRLNSQLKDVQDKEAAANQYYNQLKAAKANAAIKEKAADDKPTKFNNTLDEAEAKTFSKQREKLPSFKQRLTRLDKALAVLEKVRTGPLAGKDIPYLMQKLVSEDAQALEFFLAGENVQLIMDFAKEAGVRAIDTPEEQRRLLDSIANKEQSPEVMRKAIADMKGYMAEAVSNIKAKDTHYRKYGNLREFQWPSDVAAESKSGAPSAFSGMSDADLQKRRQELSEKK